MAATGCVTYPTLLVRIPYVELSFDLVARDNYYLNFEQQSISHRQEYQNVYSYPEEWVLFSDGNCWTHTAPNTWMLKPFDTSWFFNSLIENSDGNTLYLALTNEHKVYLDTSCYCSKAVRLESISLYFMADAPLPHPLAPCHIILPRTVSYFIGGTARILCPTWQRRELDMIEMLTRSFVTLQSSICHWQILWSCSQHSCPALVRHCMLRVRQATFIHGQVLVNNNSPWHFWNRDCHPTDCARLLQLIGWSWLFCMCTAASCFIIYKIRLLLPA